ncbi:AMP-binding protein [Roseateles oligotrophus]|uniref:AMP-binding protein n=1 Tax=Roseateles oligotrophus TaxID=1769250 RepID=A0ABT2YDE2_9BURK|nr:AMP-binding protein [Roseateles oligotrophus]MCV2368073.1 AMP-binding protein [Roseateles oligotrophus]
MSGGELAGLMADCRAGDSLLAKRGSAHISWRDFRAQCAAWRRAFEAHPGQRFALYFEDSADFAAALFGLWHAGKVAYLPGDGLPATVQALKPLVDAMVGDLAGAAVLPQAAQAGLAEADWPPLKPQAEQLVIFTSGSTAAPLAIGKRLGQLFSEVASLERVFGGRLGAKAEVLSTVSHQHIYGLLFRVLWPLAAGRVFHARRYAFVEEIAAALPPDGGALLIASPAHLRRLPAVSLHDLRAVFSSGGPLPDEALPDCLRLLGQAPIEVFGSSETGGIAWRQRNPQAPSSWSPLPGVEWRIEEDLLEIRSPHLPAFTWLSTADRACALGASFELMGRADRLLKIEEKRVSVAAIEAALLATACLSELRVLSLRKTAGGREQLAVVAVPSERGWAMYEELGKKGFGDYLRKQLLQSLEPVSAPRRWRFVSRLPFNSQGKSTQRELLALFDPLRPTARLLQLTATRAELSLLAEAGLPQFDGHFDGHPVLPGVAQVDWAIRFGRECFTTLPAKFVAMEGLKFQQVITPGMTLSLQLDYKPEAAQLAFKFSSGRGAHASGRLLFGGAD